ncbi:protein of unknown function [Candidatus Promineifilum breve]|uniref:Uncharacterized protein n=1 Tax=Candidatus Promineifilum breve TaxID=1806508 RepID=A0A160T510_9CHLR|nr:hypothetical protein [Candidatus Promineifilum breve]CUS05256.2 protein of unknown function [Candidatus Promineifilum breve]
MHESAQRQIQALPGKEQLITFAGRLLEWLNRDLNPRGEPLSESRARAMLLAANVLDEPTRHSFAQALESEQGMRLALYDLLRESGLADKEEIAALATATAGLSAPAAPASAEWLALAVAAHAWRSDFLLDRLDPAAPPDPYSPAGQVLKRAAYYVRQEVQRSATERDKLGRKLAHAAAGPPTLDSMRPDAPIAPLPPYFRPPVPERYPEYTPGLQLSSGEVETPATPRREEPISISDADLSPPAPSAPQPQPPLRIDASQLEPPAQPATQRPAPRPPAAPRANVVMPNATAAANTAGATDAARRMGRGRGAMKATKLHVVVQEHPDGPGLYGLQVRVSSRGIRRYVAGTTNKDGEFVCELPVQVDAGLTYDVDVTWPRDFGGEVERKSITLNADRTHFNLPFYRTLKA